MIFLCVIKEMAGFFEVGVTFSWKFEPSASIYAFALSQICSLLLNTKIFTREPTNLF